MDIQKNKNYKQYLITNHERIVTIAVLILLVMIVVFIAPAGIDKTDEPGFAKEAKLCLDRTKIFGFSGGDFQYESAIADNVGVATCFQQCDYDYVDRYRQVYMEKILGEIEPDPDKFQAVYFNSAVCESDKNTCSMLISYTIAEYHHNKRTFTQSAVKTWLFNKETGTTIHPEQLFYEDYRNLAAGYFAKLFTDTNKLADEGQAALTQDRGNFNKFMIDEQSIYFFFNPGEVYKESEGIQETRIWRTKAVGWVRDELLKRFVDPDKPMVALTYDDGPGGKAEAKIHKYLKKYNAVATFFYSGYMIKGHEAQMKETVELGCEIGNHTWNHPVLTRCDDKELKKQLYKTNKRIKKACGQAPTVFRPSYGATNKHVNKMSKLPVIIWDIDTQDWKTRDAKKIYKSVTKKKKKLDGKIVLMHSLYPETAKATKMLLPWLEENGYQTVTVSELIKYRYNEEPKKGKVYSGWY